MGFSNRLASSFLEFAQRVQALPFDLPRARVDDSCNPNQLDIESAIPLIVRQTWVDKTFGKRHAQSLLRMREENTEFTFEIWDEMKVDSYMASRWGGRKLGELYQRAKFGPLRSDVFRYAVTWDYGGFYFDISKGLTQPILSLYDRNETEFLTHEANLLKPGMINDRLELRKSENLACNWGFGFAPRHAFLNHLIHQIECDFSNYENAIVENPKEGILRLTGPIALTKALHSFQKSGGELNFSGIDFFGNGIFSLPGSEFRYWRKPSYFFSGPARLFQR